MTKEFNVLALIKGQERYVFVYDDASYEAVVEAFNLQAANPELSLNWFDAVVLTQKAEEQSKTRPGKEDVPQARF